MLVKITTFLQQILETFFYLLSKLCLPSAWAGDKKAINRCDSQLKMIMKTIIAYLKFNEKECVFHLRIETGLLFA